MQNIKIEPNCTVLENEFLMDCKKTKCNKNKENNEYCMQKTENIEGIRKSHKKCGEIYMTGIENFKFVCMLCEKTFFTCIEEFLSHVIHCQQKDEICTFEIDPLEPQKDFDYSPVEQTNSKFIPQKEVENNFDSNAEIDPTLNPVELLSLSIESDVEKSNCKKILEVGKTENSQEKFDQSKKHCSKSSHIFSCNQCNKEYLWKRSLERHMKVYHQHDVKAYSIYVYCDFPDCNKKFEKKESLDTHKRLEHKEDPVRLMVEENNYSNDKFEGTKKMLDRYTCKYCEKCFKAPYLRIEHERIHTGEKPFKCSTCGKGFRIVHTRNTHELTHQGIKPYKCDICNASFLEKSNLSQHIRRHSGDKRIKCEFCEKTFHSNSEKNLHETTHTGEKSYLCFECGKCFNSNSILNTHMKRHSGIKPHKCDQCDKSFFIKKLLRDHYVVHTRERPFSCNVCGSKFPRRSSLKTHLKIHSDVAQYSCTICGKSFKQGPGLYCHMKSHGKVMANS